MVTSTKDIFYFFENHLVLVLIRFKFFFRKKETLQSLLIWSDHCTNQFKIFHRKSAYAVHKYADVPLQFVLGEESSKVVRFRTLYEKAVSIASQMMNSGETSLDVAVIGRFRSQSAAAALAQVHGQLLYMKWIYSLW